MIFINRGLKQSLSDGKWFDPWISQHWDLHRRVAERYRNLPAHLTANDIFFAVENFKTLYGDLFIPGEVSRHLSRTGAEVPTLDAAVKGSKFLVEWRDIAEAIELIEDEQGNSLLDKEAKEVMPSFSYNKDQVPNSVISLKIQQYTSVEFVKRLQTSTNRTMAIRPTSLAGWIWALICRDVVENIDYKDCSGFDICGRELPNLTPGGKMALHCSGSCQKRASRKKILANPSLVKNSFL